MAAARRPYSQTRNPNDALQITEMPGVQLHSLAVGECGPNFVRADVTLDAHGLSFAPPADTTPTSSRPASSEAAAGLAPSGGAGLGAAGAADTTANEAFCPPALPVRDASGESNSTDATDTTADSGSSADSQGGIGGIETTLFVPYLAIASIDVAKDFEMSDTEVRMQIKLRTFHTYEVILKGEDAKLLFDTLAAQVFPRTLADLHMLMRRHAKAGTSAATAEPGCSVAGAAPDDAPAPADAAATAASGAAVAVAVADAGGTVDPRPDAADTGSTTGSTSSLEARFAEGRPRTCTLDEYNIVHPETTLACAPDPAFARMGVPNARWRYTGVNKNYELCDTYPAALYVPASITDEQLTSAATFRSKGRIPSLCYLHKSGAAIARCAQPLCGVSGRRNTADEHLVVGTFIANNANRGLPSKEHNIIDARPKLNALANQAAGKGYETSHHYSPYCKVHFLEIDNIHEMRASLDDLLEACQAYSCSAKQREAEAAAAARGASGPLPGLPNAAGDGQGHAATAATAATPTTPTTPSALPHRGATSSPSARAATIEDDQQVKDSRWLQHVQSVLFGAMKVARMVDTDDETVLVHCSDGWDRTAQLTALAQVRRTHYLCFLPLLLDSKTVRCSGHAVLCAFDYGRIHGELGWLAGSLATGIWFVLGDAHPFTQRCSAVMRGAACRLSWTHTFARLSGSRSSSRRSGSPSATSLRTGARWLGCPTTRRAPSSRSSWTVCGSC